MKLSTKAGIFALVAGASISAPALAENDFCQQVNKHGPRSWQALAAYDASTPAHGGQNLYMMSEEQRKEALGAKSIPNPMLNRYIEQRLRYFREFAKKSDQEKTQQLVLEIQKHGIGMAKVVKDLKACTL